MDQEHALGVLNRALSFVKAPEATLSFGGVAQGATRYANNAITQNVFGDRRTLRITAAFGRRVGAATTNQTDDSALRDVVRRAEEAARASDEDPEHLPPLPPQRYPDVRAWAASTAHMTPAERAGLASCLVGDPVPTDEHAAGSVTTEASFLAVANTAGLQAWHEATNACVVHTVIADSASGWAGRGSFDVSTIPVSDLGEIARAKARAARHPIEVEPGPTTVVLEPQATADLIEYLLWEMDARAADEGRSAFSGKDGDTLAGPDITIRSVPGHPAIPGAPFASDGAPIPEVTWIERGVLKTLRADRFWAEKAGRPRADAPDNIIMEGGEASTEDLIARVSDGLLVTRFWYIRSVDPMRLLLTGMTRDGLYRIRDGRVVGPAVNMRFNESPLRMLANVAALGTPMPTRDAILAPPLLVNDFRFTSVTRF